MFHIVVFIVCLLPWINLAMPKHILNAIVLKGDSIVLNCTANPTHWRFLPLNHTGHDDGDRDIYRGGKLVSKGFRITGNQTVREVNLIIDNVTFEMAGEYKCWKAHEELNDYKLCVLENIPVCWVTPVSDDRTVLHVCTGSKTQHECSGSCNSPQNGDAFRASSNEFIGPNTCNIPQDRILVSCSVTYYGHNAPVLELRNLRDNKIIEMSCNTTKLDAKIYRNRLTCNVTLNATLDLDGAQFIWQTNQSTRTQYSCTTEPIKILYSIDGTQSNHTAVQLHVDDKLNCTANCSHPCSYKWTWSEKSVHGVHIYEQCTKELIANRLGSYRCEARCQMGRHMCEVTVMHANVSSSTVSHHDSFIGKESKQTTVSKGDKVVCSYIEEVEDDLSRTMLESTNNVLIANKIGLHRCEAQCKLRNQTCTIFPQYIKVIESEGNLTNIEDPLALIQQLLEKENNQSLWTPPLIVLLILGILQYLTFGCYLLTRMRRKTATPDGNHEMTSRTNSQVQLSPVSPVR